MSEWTVEPLVDIWGSQALTDSEMPTYSAAFAVAPVATPTDVFGLVAGSSKTVRLRKVILFAQATAAWGPVLFAMLRRTTATTGGLPTTVSIMSHNTSVAPDATVVTYGANPAGLGTNGGNLLAFYGAANTSLLPVTYSYDVGMMAPRAATPGGFYCNFGGAAIPAGFFVGCTIVWSETT